MITNSAPLKILIKLYIYLLHYITEQKYHNTSHKRPSIVQTHQQHQFRLHENMNYLFSLLLKICALMLLYLPMYSSNW